MRAVFVVLARPEWSRSCEQCRKYIHDDDGRIKLFPPPPTKGGKPVLRPAASEPPCQSCPKIPSSAPVKHWDYAADLTPMLADAWDYYRTCRAVNRFPDDPIVEECAVLIREAEDAAEQHDKRMDNYRLESLIQLAMRRR